MSDNYWPVKSIVKPSIFLITALNFKEMSCANLWIQYGITDNARMKGQNVICYAYFSPLYSKNIISGSCQYTQKQGLTSTECYSYMLLSAENVVSLVSGLLLHLPRKEKRFLWRVTYDYMGFTTPSWYVWQLHCQKYKGDSRTTGVKLFLAQNFPTATQEHGSSEAKCLITTTIFKAQT